MTIPAVEPPTRQGKRFQDRAACPDPLFSTNLSRTQVPARGLFYSLLAHTLFWVATLYVPWSYWLPPEPHIAAPRSAEAHEVLLLPNLAPTDNIPAEQSSDRGRQKPPRNDASASSQEAKAAHGMVYQGPQLIISNPPHPDNFIQTIRQPDIAALKLPAPLPLPSMVSIVPARTVFVPPAPDVVPPKPVADVTPPPPINLPQQEPKVDAPKLPLPADAPADALQKIVNAAPSRTPTIAKPQPAVSGSGEHNILVVNAIPSPDLTPSAVPPGELHGNFTVLPAGSTVPNGLGAGTTDTKATVGSGTSGSGSGPHPGAENRPTGGTGAGKAATTTSGLGTGKASGTAGNATAKTPGGGGNGSGGRGKMTIDYGASPFPGITIQGGSGGGSRTGVKDPVAAKRQTSYGMTIVASGSSGGGFRDFGVFHDETSYTVYVDMTDMGAYGATWTLQYALDLHSAPNLSAPAHGLLVPPYATLKSLPHFSAEAAWRSRGRTIVVFGIVGPEGKLQGLQIMQSPDPAFDQPLLDSLRQWTFQPAEIGGVHVPVKFLLGVPVSSVPNQ